MNKITEYHKVVSTKWDHEYNPIRTCNIKPNGK